MGTRIITDASRLSLKGGVGVQQNKSFHQSLSTEQISGQYKVNVVNDGTSGKEGLPPDLPANVAWLDGSGLYRSGNNFGPSFLNTGQVSCVVSGCGGPRDYAYNVTAGRVSELAPLWTVIDTLAPGDAAETGNKIYSLFKFEFSAAPGSVGSVAVVSG